MYIELYIDLLFLENFMTDSLILLAVGRILKCKNILLRSLAGGVLGSFLTCLVIILPFPVFVKIICFYGIIPAVMITSGLGIWSIARYLKAYILIYAAGIVLGGVMQLIRPWMRTAVIFYVAAAAGYIMFICLWKLISCLLKRYESILCVTLYSENREMTVNALLDTGNDLSDVFTGEPVSILSVNLAEKISLCPESERGFHIIPYRCVSGESIMRVFHIDRMCVHLSEKESGEVWIENPLVGISSGDISNGGYDMILNPHVLPV